MTTLHRIAAALACIVALLVVPTHSFGSSPTAAGLGRSNTSTSAPPSLLSTSNTSPPFIDQLWGNKSGTHLFLSNDNRNNEGGEDYDEGLFAEKNIPGLVFTTILTLWHFWIGPALRPIILDIQQ